MLGSQLAGLKFFHVIAKLNFSVFHRRAEILANRASPAKRASPPHVIGPLVLTILRKRILSVWQQEERILSVIATGHEILLHLAITDV